MIVTRFAPSPTGFLHIGHAFAALTASSGSDRFLLRIEDIDRTRARDSYREAIFEDLAWLGIRWESPVRVQSEHFDDYRAALNVLAGNGLLYPCFCTRREITEAANAPHQGPDGPRYPGSCRKLSSEERQHRIARDDAYALRLDVEKALAATKDRKSTRLNSSH